MAEFADDIDEYSDDSAECDNFVIEGDASGRREFLECLIQRWHFQVSTSTSLQSITYHYTIQKKNTEKGFTYISPFVHVILGLWHEV